jgi:hypothetical protein
MKTPHRGILALVIAHAAVVHPWAFAAAKWESATAHPYCALVLWGPFFALIFAQVALVALWAGLGRARLWIRLPVAAAAVGYLGTVLGVGLSGVGIETYTVTALAGCLMWAVTMAVRRFRARLVLAEAGCPVPEGLQFTIRHLFILTGLVACLVAGGRMAAPDFPATRLLLLLVIIALVGVSFAAVGLAAMWAMLGERRPWLRCIATVLIAAGFALLLKFVHPSQMHEWVCILIMEAIWLLLSLYVVRRCGYRLVSVRRPAS